MDEYRTLVDLLLIAGAVMALGIYALAATCISAQWRAWRKRRAERLDYKGVLIRTRRVMW